MHNVDGKSGPEPGRRPVIDGLLGAEPRGQHGDPQPPGTLSDDEEPKGRSRAQLQREPCAVEVVLFLERRKNISHLFLFSYSPVFFGDTYS